MASASKFKPFTGVLCLLRFPQFNVAQDNQTDEIPKHVKGTKIQTIKTYFQAKTCEANNISKDNENIEKAVLFCTTNLGWDWLKTSPMGSPNCHNLLTYYFMDMVIGLVYVTDKSKKY